MHTPLLPIGLLTAGLLTAGLLSAGPALAQVPPSAPVVAPSAAAPSDADAALVKALDLPAAARSLRNAGVPEADVRSSLGAMRGAGVSAGDAAEVTEAAIADVSAHGPVDNFGAFVQESLASGLRGQALAAAISAEHASRGKGKGAHAAAHADGAAHGHGKPDGAGHEGHGKPENAGHEHGAAGHAGHEAAGNGKRDGAGRPGMGGNMGKGKADDKGNAK